MTDDSEGYDGNLSGMKFARTCMQTLQRHEFALFRDTDTHTQARTHRHTRWMLKVIISVCFGRKFKLVVVLTVYACGVTVRCHRREHVNFS